MDNNYAIYSYRFIKCKDDGDWTQEEEVTTTEMNVYQDWN